MPNRTICDVLEEARQCIKTLNFSYLISLLEEIQTMANRMEAKLYDISDLEHLDGVIKKKKKELKDLESKETK